MVELFAHVIAFGLFIFEQVMHGSVTGFYLLSGIQFKPKLMLHAITLYLLFPDWKSHLTQFVDFLTD